MPPIKTALDKAIRHVTQQMRSDSTVSCTVLLTTLIAKVSTIRDSLPEEETHIEAKLECLFNKMDTKLAISRELEAIKNRGT